MELRETLRSVAKEYARQVGDIIEHEPQYWVAEHVCVDCCCFGDIYFLTLEDMQIIVDHLDDWVEKYGSKEKVGDTVREWFDWVIEDAVDDIGNYRDHPRINLWSWMKGLRPEQLKWTELDEQVKLQQEVTVLREVLKTYPTATIENVVKQISSRIKEMDEKVERELKDIKKIME